jgi:hypothetical protein
MFKLTVLTPSNVPELQENIMDFCESDSTSSSLAFNYLTSWIMCPIHAFLLYRGIGVISVFGLFSVNVFWLPFFLALLHLFTVYLITYSKIKGADWVPDTVSSLLTSYQQHDEAIKYSCTINVVCRGISWKQFTLRDWWLFIKNAIDLSFLSKTRSSAYKSRRIENDAYIWEKMYVVLGTPEGEVSKGSTAFTLFHELGHFQLNDEHSDELLSTMQYSFLSKCKVLESLSELNRDVYGKTITSFVHRTHYYIFSEIHADLHGLYWAKKLCSPDEYEKAIAYHENLRTPKTTTISPTYFIAMKYAHLVRQVVAMDFKKFEDAFEVLQDLLETEEIGAWGALLDRADLDKLDKQLVCQVEAWQGSSPIILEYPWNFDKQWSMDSVLNEDEKQVNPEALRASAT